MFSKIAFLFALAATSAFAIPAAPVPKTSVGKIQMVRIPAGKSHVTMTRFPAGRSNEAQNFLNHLLRRNPNLRAVSFTNLGNGRVLKETLK